MKRNFLFAALLTLMVMTGSAYAQKAGSYSGTWTLDPGKSKLGERNSIESQTMTVVQTDKDIKVSIQTKRAAPPEGAPGGGGMGGRPGGGGGMGESSATYTLDGKETTIQQTTPAGQVPVTVTGKVDGGKVKLASSRTLNTQMGEVTVTSKETWALSEDGNTLTVERENTSPRGTSSTTSVYVRKQ